MPASTRQTRRRIRFSLLAILCTLTVACIVFAAMRDMFWVLVIVVPPISFLCTSVALVFVAAMLRDVRLALYSKNWQPIRSWLGLWWFVVFIVAGPIVLRFELEVSLDKLQHPADREIIIWISRVFAIAGVVAALWHVVAWSFSSVSTTCQEKPPAMDSESATRT